MPVTFLSSFARRAWLLRQSSFIANAGKLLAFTVLGQIITLASAPLLSRLFSPADFGKFGIFLMFAIAASGLASLSYDAAIPAPPKDKDAAALTFGAGVVALVICPLISGAYLLLIVFNILGFGVLPLWSAALMYLLLITYGGASILQYWCIRRQAFTTAGQGAVTMNAARAIAQIGAGLIASTWVGLASGEIFGRFMNAAFLGFKTGRELLTFRKTMDYRFIWLTLVNYRRVALVLLPAMTIDAIVSAIVVPFMTVLFGIAIAGQYFLMRRVMDLPMVVMTRTVADAFYGKISEYVREQPEKIRPFLLQVFVMCTIGAALLFLPLLFFGPTLFAYIFGEKWRIAGMLAAIMTPAVAVSLGAAPVTRIFYLTKLPQLRYVFSGLTAAGTLVVFVTAKIMHLTLVETTAGLSAATFLAYTGYFLTAYIASAHIHTDTAAIDDAPDDVSSGS